MANYEWVATTAPKQNRHDDIWFVSAKDGWAINSAGQILKTADAGETWVEQAQTGRGTYLRCLAFSDEKCGWVGSTTRASRLWKTNDGGGSWNKVTNLPPEPTAICGLWAVDKHLIYAAGTNYPNRPTAILKTEDGGNSWTSFSMQTHADLLVDIFFLDDKTGWVVGGKGGNNRKDITPVVLFTKDGGRSWNNQLEGLDIQFPKGEWGWKIQFLDNSVGFVSLENFDEGAFLKTVDAGKTWVREIINDSQNNANIEGIGFLNQTTGWAGGWGDRDFRGGYTSETNDGGASWSNANYVGRFINRFRFTGDQNIVAYASGDTVYRYQKAEQPIHAFGAVPEPPRVILTPSLISEPTYRNDGSVTLSANISPGATRLTIEIWDRFAGYVTELEDILNPAPGLHFIAWSFTGSEGESLVDTHFILRVTIDDRAESKILSNPMYSED